MEICAHDRLFVLDAGTGIQWLGQQLCSGTAASTPPIHLLLSHYHWDHIQGLPLFQPLYRAETRLDLFGPAPEGKHGQPNVLQTLFRPPFFPVAADELPARCTLNRVDWQSEFALDGVRIRTCRLNHPDGSLAYRLEVGEVSVVYATDHEPGDPGCDRALSELLQGADLFISDAQYHPQELAAGKRGWGHGCWVTSVALALAAQVKNLLLFHHDPWRSDEEVDAMVGQARQVFPRAWPACEGMCVEVTTGELRLDSSEPTLHQDSVAPEPAEATAGGNGSDVREPSNGQGSRQFSCAAPREHTSAAAPKVAGSQPRNGSAPLALADNGREGLATQRRRYERIPLETASAYAVVANGARSKMLRVLDLSFGGVSLLLDEETRLPEVFHARLRVPVLPVAEYKLRRLHTQHLAGQMWRVGCCFT